MPIMNDHAFISTILFSGQMLAFIFPLPLVRGLHYLSIFERFMYITGEIGLLTAVYRRALNTFDASPPAWSWEDIIIRLWIMWGWVALGWLFRRIGKRYFAILGYKHNG